MRKWKMTHRYTNLVFTRCLLGIMVIALALMVAPVYAGGGNSGHHGKGGKGGSAGKKGQSASVETVSASSAVEVNMASAADESSGKGKGGKGGQSGQGGKGSGKAKSGSSKAKSESSNVASSSSSSSSGAKGSGKAGGGKNGGSGSAGKGKNSDSWSGGGSHSDVVKDSTTEDEDSDQPAWAGKDGDHSLRPGGGNHGKDTKKGGDYGDLFVMSRDDDGTLLEYHADGSLCEDGEGDCYPAALLFDEEGNLLEDVFVLSPDAEAPDNVLEVELGRLNISRAPNKVLEHALAEALSKLDPDMDGYLINLENWMTLTDTAGRLLSPDTMLAIDSPLENLAVFQALLAGYNPLAEETGVTIESGDYSITVDYDVLPQIAAAALAGASDKHDIMSIDEVSYLSKFLEVEDNLKSMVEDYDDWYTPETIYNVEMSVLSIDDTTTPPVTEWVDVNLLDSELDLFNDIPEIEEDENGIDVFTQAVDDSLQVIEFVHDNIVM